MNTVVFDIETVAQDFNQLDEARKVYLLKGAETEEDKNKAIDQMALWALTNQIVAIGMLSVETQKGAVYFNGESGKEFEENNIKYWAGSEKEILEKFWQAISRADRFVTFNGRGFDCPVLMLRSAMQKVKPTKNLMPYRYSAEAHIDLLEQLTFYNSVRKFNLDFFCKSFGIESPKAQGVTGQDVGTLFAAGEREKIARYCAGDLFATRQLYLRWKEYIQM
ncbi:MAG: hypothetical protein A2921_00740 [Candidatus Magasanikbacteria bacterium RIFCSPLOWO2_01_FULL_43_20b]|uniref:Predicted 3'-5' exonuclease PolB-like domain-containing protein n=1 Tax=Candidatus Magasanikbacteria bacterium RIFCSPLOWO2_12_FULL_43_12 TaxID=1798692 RepID=A0A1F6MVC7_9BACT|nr:MAG: hypothetical protein A3I93_04605 [Candidatus Magasanikbacteria bacterium RIFCSPLOWO2_02_FULL_43_22]OGH72808.1 MAG: hypothetical protein A2921_00740 [Candidatus Magasanikbacteria bacterium RIFCSPLOWO2_01_FULL_43_20b]OGH75604.1 MAG: hypothetical protein A3G00_03855 [Candidatus Magasanikbacteria bacterium RIFCSPLOWO2_12_FULL_43_12]